MDAWVKATSLVLCDKKLTKELANMILLPWDWKEWKSQSLEVIFAYFFPALIRVSTIYSFFIKYLNF